MRKLVPIAALAVASMILVGCNLLPQAPTSNTSTGNSGTPTANGAAGTNGGANQNNTGTPTSGGNPKSQYWPSDIPTLDGGYEFTYAQYGGSYYLSYKVTSDKDAHTLAAQISTAMTGAGWTLPSDGSIESDTSVYQSYTNATNQTVVTVSKDDNTTNIYSVTIISGPKSS